MRAKRKDGKKRKEQWQGQKSKEGGKGRNRRMREDNSEFME